MHNERGQQLRRSQPASFARDTCMQVSVLDAYKRLHDSKKRGQQSLAEVPMEHLAKASGAGTQATELPTVLNMCAGVDHQAHG